LWSLSGVGGGGQLNPEKALFKTWASKCCRFFIFIFNGKIWENWMINS
jgi:hypothetical protein